MWTVILRLPASEVGPKRDLSLLEWCKMGSEREQKGESAKSLI